MPQVSVIMPVYNEEDLVASAIESILVQTFADFEFIIIDDGSTDGSKNIIRDFANKDSRIVILENGKNLGLVTSLNIGIENATGEWIARMDADDISLPDRLKKQIKYLDLNPDVDLVSTGLRNITLDGVEISERCLPTNPSLLAWKSLFSSPAFHGTIVARKELIIRAGGYRSDYKLEDNYLWSRMLSIPGTRFGALEEILYLYRRPAEEFEEIISERTLATREICIDYIEHLVGRDLSEEIYAVMAAPAFEEEISPRQANLAIHYLVELQQKMLEMKLFRLQDLERIDFEVAKKVNRISLIASTYNDLAGSLSLGLLTNLIWPHKKPPLLVRWIILFLAKPKQVLDVLFVILKRKTSRDSE